MRWTVLLGLLFVSAAPSALAPNLLLDTAETEKYVAAFPADAYEVVESKGVGRFYVDKDRSRDIIKDYLRAGRVWEPHIIKLLQERARPGTTVIDAGAHVGLHTVTMARAVGKDGLVVAFEPQRKIYRELRRNLAANDLTNVVALRFALGDEPGIVEMDPAVSGNEGGTAVGHGGDKAELRTLDSFDLHNVSLVKIDVEGFELKMLKGAAKTIRRERPVIIIEVLGNGPHFQEAEGPARQHYLDVFAFIESLGYERPRNLQAHDYLATPK